MEEGADSNHDIINQIRNWMTIENRISELSKELRELRKHKKEINTQLLSVMKNNEIDCFDCKSGQIMYTKNNVKKAINKSYLQEIIIKYFGTENIGTANELCDFILNNRQIETRENIKFKKNQN